jgi:hypothetical protein
MDIDIASTFLAGGVLVVAGFIVIVAGICAINNIIHKFWKPVKVFTEDSWNLGTGRFADTEIKKEEAKVVFPQKTK